MAESVSTTGEAVLLIQAATGLEFESLRQAFGNLKPETENGRVFFEPMLSQKTIVLRGGVGAEKAAVSLRWAAQRWNLQGVVDFGTAGGLAPELAVGTVVVEGWTSGVLARVALFPEITVVGEDAMGLAGTAGYTSLVCTRGRIAESAVEIEGIDERHALHRETHALAVAWESGVINRICLDLGISFSSFRVISDVGNGSLPQEYAANAAACLKPAAKVFCGVFKNFEMGLCRGLPPTSRRTKATTSIDCL